MGNAKNIVKASQCKDEDQIFCNLNLVAVISQFPRFIFIFGPIENNAIRSASNIKIKKKRQEAEKAKATALNKNFDSVAKKMKA